MTRSFRYRLSPTQAQERTLQRWLGIACELYNAALQERREAWAKQRVSLREFDQFRELPGVRAARADVAAVPTVVLRGALSRVDKAFAGFFRRCAGGDAKAGYPRFKKRSRFASILIDDFSYLTRDKPLIVGGGKRVVLPRVGKIKLKMHRPLKGKPKGLRLVLDNGRWFVSFFCVDVPAAPKAAIERAIGIDLGIIHFAATSDGATFSNPRPLVQARIAMERAQRRWSRRKKGSVRRRKAARLLARRHARVANVRRENHIAVARQLVANYDTIFVEELTIERMARSKLAKSVRDAAWGNFLHWLHVKAEEAGREVTGVDPRGTSQRCSGCGVTVKKALAVRTHDCPHCGLVLDRDINAARNILSAGMALRGAALLARGQQGSEKVESDQRGTAGSGDS